MIHDHVAERHLIAVEVRLLDEETAGVLKLGIRVDRVPLVCVDACDKRQGFARVVFAVPRRGQAVLHRH